MKKLISLLLCAALLIGTSVTAFAEQNGEPASVQDAAVENGSAEPGEAMPQSEEDPFTVEADENGEDKGVYLGTKDLTDVEPEPYKPSPLEREAQIDDLLASEPTATGSGTVEVTVKLPPEITDEMDIYVYLCTPAKADETGRVTEEPGFYSSRLITVSESGTVTFENVADGDYIVGTYVRNSGSMLVRNTCYYNNNGTVAADMYTASSFEVSGGNTVKRTVTLPKAQRIISGTVTFTEALEEDMQINIETNPYNGGSNYYAYYYLEAGTKSLDFSIGADSGIYALELYGMGQNFSSEWMYYSVDGELGNNYSSRYYFLNSEDDITGVEINGDPLLKGTEVSNEAVPVTVTVTLPEPAKTNYYTPVYAIYAIQGENVYDYINVSARSEEPSISATFYLPKGGEFRFGYANITNARIYWDISPDTRFMTEDGGITTDVSKAKTYVASDKLTEVTIVEPESYKISGKLTRGEYAGGISCSAYVFAEFDNGETFASRVVFPPEEEEFDYVIYVPKTRKGADFELYAARSSDVNANRIDETSITDSVSYTLSDDTDVDPIYVGADGVTVSGTIALPEDLKSVDGQMAVRISGVLDVYYLVPEGQTTVEYSYTDYVSDPASFTATLLGGEKVFGGMRVSPSPDADGNYSDVDFTFGKTATISGSVYLPDNVSDIGANVYIYATGTGTFASVLKGGDGVGTYSLNVPDGEQISMYARVEFDTEDVLSSDNIYIDSNWENTDVSGNGPTVNGDRAEVDFHLARARLLTGSFVSEDDTALNLGGLTNASFRLLNMSGSSSYYGTAQVASDGTWTIKIPSNLMGTFRMYASFYPSGGNVQNGEYYYNTTGKAITDQNDPNVGQLVLEEGDVNGITIPLSTGWVVSGSLIVPEGGYFSSSRDGYSMNVYARTEDGSQNKYGYAYVTNGSGPWEFSIVVPKTEAVYDLSIRTTPNDCDTNIIFTGEKKGVSVSGNTAGADIELTIAKYILSGTIRKPAGFNGYASVNLYVYFDNGGSYNTSVYIYNNETSGEYSILIPDTETGTAYTMNYYTYTSGLQRNGYIGPYDPALREYTVLTRSTDAEHFTIGEDDVHNFTLLEKGPYVRGKVYVPEGIEGTFSIGQDIKSGDMTYIDTNSLKKDANGRYFTYEFYDDYDRSSFRLSFEVENDTTHRLPASFYVNPDGTVTTNYYDAKYFQYDGTTVEVDFTLPYNKLIVAKLASPDGDAIKLPDDPDTYASYVSAYLVDFGNILTSSTLDSDGTLYIMVPENTENGETTLRLSITDNAGNVLEGNYYYGTTPNVITDANDENITKIQYEGKDITGLTFYVNTGWVLTGDVVLPEGGYVDLGNYYGITSWIYAYPQSGSGSYNSNVSINDNEGPWSYSITVPKSEDTYTIRYSGGSYSSTEVDTNVIFDMTVEVEDVPVNGSGKLPDIVLEKQRETITGTITRPEGVSGYLSITVYVETDQNKAYSQSLSMSSSGSSVEYSVKIPSSDTSKTYKVRYVVYNNDLASNGYLTRDGVSAKVDDAYPFSFGMDSSVHDFELLKLIPFVAGKIYVPEGVEGRICGALNTGSRTVTIDVNTEELSADTDGRLFIPYEIKPYNGSTEFEYYVSYTLNTNTTAEGLWLSKYLYVKDTTGALTDTNTGYIFKYDGSSTLELNFTLATWDFGSEDYIIQSPHGIKSGTYKYTYEVPGAQSYTLHFTSNTTYTTTGIEFKVNDSTEYIGSGYSRTVYADKLDITYTVDSESPIYGFAIDQITVTYAPGAEKTTVASAVYTESGSDNKSIMQDLGKGKAMTAVFVGDSSEAVTRKAIAALYDANGRFIESVVVDVELTDQGVAARFDFNATENIKTVKIMLIDDSGKPIIKEIEIQ